MNARAQATGQRAKPGAQAATASPWGPTRQAVASPHRTPRGMGMGDGKGGARRGWNPGPIIFALATELLGPKMANLKATIKQLLNNY